MVNENITFSDLEKLLYKLGFSFHDTENAKVFSYVPADVLIVLPRYYQTQDMLRSIHLVAIRRILDETGLMSHAAFDGFLEKIEA